MLVQSSLRSLGGAISDPAFLRKGAIPAVFYPLWHLAAPASATDPWIVWWIVGGSFLLVSILSLRSRFAEEHLQDLHYACSWLVTLQLYVLAHLNDMHPFYAVGSVMAVLVTVVFMRSKRALLVYSSFVALLSVSLHLFELALWASGR